jgi:alkylhydroperoxidase family enzyme
LNSYETSDLFDPQEKMAIRFAELLALNHRQIDDAFMSALREQFTDPQIMELGTMIGLYLGVGRLVAVLGLEGPACAIG